VRSSSITSVSPLIKPILYFRYNCGPCHNCNGTCEYHCPAYLCSWGEAWEAHMHHQEFPLHEEGKSLIITYAFWYKFKADTIFEDFHEKLNRLEAISGRPITTVFVNAGHWHLTQASALTFCHGLQTFIETTLALLMKRGVDVYWYSNGPIDFQKLDPVRSKTWHPRTEMTFYMCSRELFAGHSASSVAWSIPFIDIYLPGRSMMSSLGKDGYHANPEQARFQVQVGLNQLCPPNAGGKRRSSSSEVRRRPLSEVS
jgi:hypothetical protein